MEGARSASPEPVSPSHRAQQSKASGSIKEELEHYMDEVTERLKHIDFQIFPRRHARPKARESVAFNSEFAASVRKPEDLSREVTQRQTVKVTPDTVSELAQIVDRKNVAKQKKPQTIGSGFTAFQARV